MAARKIKRLAARMPAVAPGGAITVAPAVTAKLSPFDGHDAFTGQEVVDGQCLGMGGNLLARFEARPRAP